MSELTPCQAGNLEDWFIEAHGRQYRDDPPLVSEDGLVAVLDVEYPDGWGHLSADDVRKVWERLERDATTRELQRRRHAKEACRECPLRLQCLTLGLQDRNLDHGIYGGYYPEERQEIDRLRRAREARRRRGGVR